MRDLFKLYFATDLHGSDKCFRKFANAASVYRAHFMVLGGDIAGKAIQALVDRGGGRYSCTFRGSTYEVEAGSELESLEGLISDHGYYPYRAQPGELDARIADGSIDGLLIGMMKERLERWTALADERLRPLGCPITWMLGNDDPPDLDEVLMAAPWGSYADGRILEVDAYHQMISLGYSNPTPFDSYRERSEAELDEVLRKLFERVVDPRGTILNVHVPPFDTGIDEAPVLDETLTVQSALGQTRFAPVGSTALRSVIEEFQPILGLHGHVHEAAGFRKIGRTVVINPGSDYGTGVLNGVLVGFKGAELKTHQFVRG